MTTHGSKGLLIGAVAGIAFTAFAANLLGQSGSAQPVKTDTQYFVTGEADDAHLWVREGATLRCVGHGECKTHGDHKGHDHGKEKKP